MVTRVQRLHATTCPSHDVSYPKREIRERSGERSADSVRRLAILNLRLRLNLTLSRSTSICGAVRSSPTKVFAVLSIFFTVCRSFAGELEARCAEAEKKGIDFLAANQQEAGQFPTQFWFWPTPERKQSFDTPFTAAQVLFSLTFCESATARGVRERAAQYILS